MKNRRMKTMACKRTLRSHGRADAALHAERQADQREPFKAEYAILAAGAASELRSAMGRSPAMCMVLARLL
jgi:hypothetical protein